MKRSLNILMALMLSFMVVYLSVGTTVMHCLRSDKVMVGMMADQSLCPILPKVLGICARCGCLKVLVVMGVNVRYDGHKYPYSWALSSERHFF